MFLQAPREIRAKDFDIVVAQDQNVPPAGGDASLVAFG
jgi:hypothetical protein